MHEQYEWYGFLRMKVSGFFLGKETETQESENCLFVWLCLAAEIT